MKKALLIIFCLLNLFLLSPKNANAASSCNLYTSISPITKSTTQFSANIPTAGLPSGTTYELNFDVCGRIQFSGPLQDVNTGKTIYTGEVKTDCISKLREKSYNVEFFVDNNSVCTDTITIQPATTDSCTFTINNVPSSAQGGQFQVGEKTSPIDIKTTINTNDYGKFNQKYGWCILHLLYGAKNISMPLSPAFLSNDTFNKVAAGSYDLSIDCSLHPLDPKTRICSSTVSVIKDTSDPVAFVARNPISGQCDKANNIQALDACQKCDIKNQVWTALGCIPSDPSGLVKWILEASINIVGGIALLIILMGIFKITTSSGNPESLNEGKDMIISAIAGLLFISLSLVILKITAGDILQIPGFI